MPLYAIRTRLVIISISISKSQVESTTTTKLLNAHPNRLTHSFRFVRVCFTVKRNES